MADPTGSGQVTQEEGADSQQQGDALIAEFLGPGGQRHARTFHHLSDRSGLSLVFNPWAALLGPIWLGARTLWLAFWPVFLVTLIGFVLVSGALLGDPGRDALARAERLDGQATARLEAAEAAIAAGDPLGEGMKRSADGLARAAEKARDEAVSARAGAFGAGALGLGLMAAMHLVTGFLGMPLLFRRFRRWRGDRAIAHGLPLWRSMFVTTFVLGSYIFASLRFGTAEAPGWLTGFPSSDALLNGSARWLDAAFTDAAARFSPLFRGISSAINGLLEVLELGLVSAPWPVVMAAVVAIAWQSAGRRVALLSALGLGYLGLFGFWEKSMATVALLGAAALLCVVIGLPLGIWAGRDRRVMTVLRPILDLMQTMPAFVYLIPVIAFFGIGKPPGIIATIIFGMPPTIRLTALGIAAVPEATREAASAFGASRLFLLLHVDLPMARGTIMAGINQTLLMCLSMVVIASLIGAKGLGEDILSALQYAAVGKGILAGLAILTCAMLIDRIVQGGKQRE